MIAVTMDMAEGEHQPDGTISTWWALESFGFQPDKSVFPNDGSAMSIYLGGLKLSAARLPNLLLVDVVAFSGVYRSPRTIASIEFELPTRLESIEQGAAWIAWHLQKQLPSQEKSPPFQEPFLLLGLSHLDTLPWVQRAARYEKRHLCSVKRSWLRQALRQLGINLELATTDDAVTVAFDGRVLTFSNGDWVVPVPAKGRPWESDFQLPATSLTALPARLNDEDVLISVWEDGLCIGRRLFTGALPVDKDVQGKDRPTFTPADSQP